MKRYSYYALFYKVPHGWDFYFKEVGGIGACDSKEDALSTARESLKISLEDMIEAGKEIPEPSPREVLEKEADDPDISEWFVEQVEVDL